MYVPNLEKFAENIISVTVPLLLYAWNNKRKAKRDEDKRHQQMLAERQFLPAHRHKENEGPLYVDGIMYTPPKPNGQ